MDDDLTADDAAHAEVILVAKEQQEAVATLATVSAVDGESNGKPASQLETERKIIHFKEKYEAAVDAIGPGGHTPLLLVCVHGRVDDLLALLALGANPAVEGNVNYVIRNGVQHLST